MNHILNSSFNKKLKQGIVLFFLVLLFIPLIQKITSFCKEKPLINDVLTSPISPDFSIYSWNTGELQENYEKYFKEHVGFRSSFIRVQNQINFDLFKQTNVLRVVAGKENVLYDSEYINSYLGKDFVGEQNIIQKVNRLAFVQRELKKKNIDLLFLIPCGKASYLSEYFPNRYANILKKRTNYDAYIEQFKKQNINFIDFRDLLQQKKRTSRYPLFPKTGVHWSGYSTTLTADTLFKRMEQLRNIDLVDFYQDGGEETYISKNTDNDICSAMNLLVDIKPWKMYYPNIVFKTKDHTKVKPNVLIIGDSFVWTWITFYPYIPNLFNDSSSFWWYNESVQWPLKNGEAPYKVSTLNFKNEIYKRDYILLVFNESNLVNGDYNFTDQMYNTISQDSIAVK